MIARTWTGWTEHDRADEYEQYMHEVALPGYSHVDGNLGVLMMRRDLEDRPWTEFTMLSLWRDRQAMEAFAGNGRGDAVFYDRDDEFLVDREWQVRAYDVYGATDHLGT
jgi:quinol monooxygenase YgiN